MIVYGSPLSPFVRKVLVYGEERGIAMTMKPVMPGATDPDFLAASPFSKMPAIEDGAYTLSDSTAIIAYLEAKHPEGALMPTDAEAVGRTIWYEEFVDTIGFVAAVPVFFNRVVAPRMGREANPAAADEAQAKALPPVYRYLESQIGDDGSDWGGPLVGERFGIADIAVGSLLMNMGHCDAAPEGDRYPKLCAWRDAVHARASFTKWSAIERKMLAQ